MVVGTVIPANDDIADGCLLTFKDAHLYINGVIFYADLYRLHIEEEVTIIHVKGTDIISVRIKIQSLIKVLQVVYIAFFYAEHP